MKTDIHFKMSISIWPHKADPRGREWRVFIKRFSDLIDNHLKWELTKYTVAVEDNLRRDHPLPRLPES